MVKKEAEYQIEPNDAFIADAIFRMWIFRSA